MAAGPTLYSITTLTELRDVARQRFFSHCDPGGLRTQQLIAWELEHCALKDLLEAAQIRLDDEIAFHALLATERADG